MEGTEVEPSKEEVLKSAYLMVGGGGFSETHPPPPVCLLRE